MEENLTVGGERPFGSSPPSLSPTLSRHSVCECCVTSKKKKKMALPLLPTPIIPLPKQQQSFPSNIRRRATTVSAELQTAVVRTGGIDYQFPSVDAPTHKVTVHDRQRGIVHEFVVPEVPSFESTIFIDVITSLFSILCCSCLLLILYLILFLYYRILIFVCDITKKLAILFLVF